MYSKIASLFTYDFTVVCYNIKSMLYYFCTVIGSE